MATTSTMLKALLGLAAVAGWQNRDKIGELINGMGGATTGANDNPKGGLRDLIDSFRQGGLGHLADSWIGTGQNLPASEPDVAKALTPQLIDDLVQQTGLPRDELLKRLSSVLPEIVDKMTPQGNLAA